MTPKARRRLRITVLLGVALLLPSCMFLPDFWGQFHSGKYDPVGGATTRPVGVALTPTAEEQTEPHTCGLHAMRSMYTAYRLDPAAFELRFRLGTDAPAVRADKDSTGTLHPDLYRVLAQDGFRAQPLDLEDAAAAADLQDHLDEQHLAFVVVYRSTYHWVLIGPSEDAGEAVVYDSLKAEPGTMPIDALLDDALSITLVEPNDGETLPASAAHAEGLLEMARLYQRKK